MSHTLDATLRMIAELSRVDSTWCLDIGARQILQGLLNAWSASRTFLALKDDHSDEFHVHASCIRDGLSDEGVRISPVATSTVLNSRKPVLIPSNGDCGVLDANSDIESIICVPLKDAEGILGILEIHTNNAPTQLSEQDSDLLSYVAMTVSLVIQNARLREEVRERGCACHTVRRVVEVQQGLLPAAPPALEHYEFFQAHEPVAIPSGDLFSYVPLSNGRLAIVLASVCGKGLIPAFWAANFGAHAWHILRNEGTPEEAARAINAVCVDTWGEVFACALIMVLNSHTHELRIVAAGLNPPIVRRGDGSVEEIGLAECDLPLGVAGDAFYEAVGTHLDIGDSMIACSPGITDLLNSDHYEGVPATIAASPGDNVKMLGEYVMNEARTLSGDGETFHDRTLLALRRFE